VSKIAYRKFIFSRMLKDYFEGSYGNVMSYMVNEETLSEADLAKLDALISESEKQSENE
jgi:predicted transcriptional regulator